MVVVTVQKQSSTNSQVKAKILDIQEVLSRSEVSNFGNKDVSDSFFAAPRELKQNNRNEFMLTIDIPEYARNEFAAQEHQACALFFRRSPSLSAALSWCSLRLNFNRSSVSAQLGEEVGEEAREEEEEEEGGTKKLGGHAYYSVSVEFGSVGVSVEEFGRMNGSSVQVIPLNSDLPMDTLAVCNTIGGVRRNSICSALKTTARSKRVSSSAFRKELGRTNVWRYNGCEVRKLGGKGMAALPFLATLPGPSKWLVHLALSRIPAFAAGDRIQRRHGREMSLPYEIESTDAESFKGEAQSEEAKEIPFYALPPGTTKTSWRPWKIEWKVKHTMTNGAGGCSPGESNNGEVELMMGSKVVETITIKKKSCVGEKTLTTYTRDASHIPLSGNFSFALRLRAGRQRLSGEM